MSQVKGVCIYIKIENTALEFFWPSFVGLDTLMNDLEGRLFAFIIVTWENIHLHSISFHGVIDSLAAIGLDNG